MQQIKRFYYQDFRGGTLDINLSPITIITGRNGSGKTRFIQALQLAIKGSVPDDVQETNIEMIELFSKTFGKKSILVGLGFENDFYFERGFDLVAKKGELKIEKNIKFSDEVETATKAGEQRIKELLGDFSPMLNVHEFIRLSEEKRASLIMSFTSLDGSKWNEAYIRSRLESKSSEVSKNEQYVAAAKELLNSGFKIVTEKMVLDVGMGIRMLIDWTGKEEAAIRREIKNSEATAQGTIEMNKMDGKTSLRPIEAIKAEIETATKDKNSLQKSINNAEASAKEHEKLLEEKKTLEEKKKTARSFDDIDNDIARKSDELTLARIPKEITDGSKKELSDLNAAVTKLETELQSVTSQGTSAKTVLESLTSAHDLIVSGHCPTCSQDVSAETIGSMDESISSQTTIVKNLQTQYRKISDELKAIKLQRDTLSLTHRNIAEHNKNIPNIVKALEAELSSLKSEKTSLSPIDERLKYISEYKNENAINVEQAKAQLEGLAQRLNDLSKENDDRITYDTRLQQVKESAAKAKKAESKLELIGVISKELKAMRREIVEEALKPIEQTAAEIFSECGDFSGKASFAFQFEDMRGNERFQFGWKTADDFSEIFIDFDSLSKSQQLFTIVAMFSPLINLANPKFKILLLDNCETVDETNRGVFFRVVSRASRYLDNIFVSYSSPAVPEDVEEVVEQIKSLDVFKGNEATVFVM